MCTNDGYDLIPFEEAFGQLVSEEVRTPSDIVMLGDLLAMAIFVIDWVSPHEIAEETALGHFPKSIYLLDVLQLYQGRLTVLSSGEMPPCRRRNLRLTRQASGRQSNISIVIS
jgi:hypothetical protein